MFSKKWLDFNANVIDGWRSVLIHSSQDFRNESHNEADHPSLFGLPTPSKAYNPTSCLVPDGGCFEEIPNFIFWKHSFAPEPPSRQLPTSWMEVKTKSINRALYEQAMII